MFLFMVSLANDSQMFFISKNIQNSSSHFLIRTVFEGIARGRCQKNLIFVALRWGPERRLPLSLCWVLLPCSWQVGTISPVLSLPPTWPNLNFHWPGELAHSTLVIPRDSTPPNLRNTSGFFMALLAHIAVFCSQLGNLRAPGRRQLTLECSESFIERHQAQHFCQIGIFINPLNTTCWDPAPPNSHFSWGSFISWALWRACMWWEA